MGATRTAYAGLLSEELDASRRGALSRERLEANAGSTGWARFKHWLRGGRPHEPLPAVLGVLERPKHGTYGICCSGGGVRSAAFNLGALQVLQAAPHRVLQRAKYLAAVSGGSYMAAGFAMVAKVDGKEDSDPELVNDNAPPFYPGSAEEQYLRNRSSYMAPGFTGKVRLIGRVVLGVLVNLLFLGSLLFVVGWILGWLIFGEWMYSGLRDPDGDAATKAAGFVALGMLALAAALGLIATLVRFKKESPIRALQAWGGRILTLAVLTALVFVVLPELIEWLREVPDAKRTQTPDTKAADLGGKNTAAAVGGTSAAALLLSILVQLRARLTDSRVLARAVESGREGLTGYVERKLLPRVRGTLVLLAAAIAGPLLLGSILFVSAWSGVLDKDPELLTVVGLVAATAFFALLSTFGDVTSWSLHPFYRRRLSTAFALRRISRGGKAVAEERNYDTQVPLSDSAVEAVSDTDKEAVPAQDKKREWPQLVVCAAANVSDPGATPPGRAVTSFTFSPRVIGGPLIGTVETKTFEDELAERKHDFTLPAAVAMSGAALSPSMGKATRWPLRFLLTLGNARLGVWVPNPRRFGEVKSGGASQSAARAAVPKAPRSRYGRPRPLLLVRELLGLNSADAKFLYITDGGHYENLGLVELLRRGCRDVYCFDASGGRDVQELGDAIALARTELQVEIKITPAAAKAVVPDGSGLATTDCVTGEIRFPGGEVGTLVYVRSVLTDAAPHDVRAYQELDPEFPHNSTGDQLYTDQRFEAYRALGRGAAERALALFLPPPGKQLGQD